MRWTAIDDHSALATFCDHGTTVALEFRFGTASGEVSAIYSPGRWGRFDSSYRQVAWEGHFRDYRTISGVSVPGHGEAGWYDGGVWHAVWEGRLLSAAYEPAP